MPQSSLRYRRKGSGNESDQIRIDVRRISARHDHHHRQSQWPPVRNPHQERHDSRHRSAQDQDRRAGFRDDELRSRLHQYGVLHQQDYFHRRRQRHPSLSRLFDRRAGGKEHLSRDRLPDSPRRAAHAAAAQGLDLPHHAPHVHSREHQEISRRLSLRRPSDGHADFDRRRALHFLSGCERHLQSRFAPQADVPPDRQDADARGVRLPAQPGHAFRLSRQRSELLPAIS